MKKYLNLVFTSLFVLLCLVPSAGMLLFGASKAGANEILAAAPTLTEKDGSFNSTVLSGAADWFGDHFALRQEMITLWARLNAAVFRTSVQEQVLLGKDGVLYYSETLDDYSGNGMEDGELNILVNNLALLQEYAEKNGVGFVFTSAPNKNTLYPEGMPTGISAGHENSNLARLPALLERAGVNYADLYAAIKADGRMLYYTTDTHWTPEGAALGADTLLAALGRSSSFAVGGFRQDGLHTGDLYEMLYPAAKTGAEPETVAEYSFSFTTAKDTNGGNAMKIQAQCPGREGKLQCWRDSFGIALYPWLAESFAEAQFSRSNSYDLLGAVNDGCDTVIIELVERNLKYLVSYMPVFPAPERETPAAEKAGGTVAITETAGNTAATAELKLVTAELDGACTGAQGCRVYVLADGTAYEAYLLLKDGSVQACLWLPGTAAVSAVYAETDGCVTEYSAG